MDRIKSVVDVQCPKCFVTGLTVQPVNGAESVLTVGTAEPCRPQDVDEHSSADDVGKERPHRGRKTHRKKIVTKEF